MTFELSQVIQVVGTLTPMFIFLYTLHRQNVTRQTETTAQLREIITHMERVVKKQGRQTDRAWRAIKMHQRECRQRWDEIDASIFSHRIKQTKAPQRKNT